MKELTFHPAEESSWERKEGRGCVHFDVSYATLVLGTLQTLLHLTLTTTLRIGATVIPVSLTDEKIEAERDKHNFLEVSLLVSGKAGIWAQVPLNLPENSSCFRKPVLSICFSPL